MSDRIDAFTAQLEGQRRALIAYLLSKVDASDWHAVQDAASDIREIESQLDLLADLTVIGDRESHG